MKLELNIDPSQLSDSIMDIFNKLTDEQKADVAMQVVKGWLELPYTVEDKANEAILLAQWKGAGKDKTYSGDIRTDAQIRADYSFQQQLKGMPNSRAVFIKDITSQVVEHHKKAIEEAIKSDPKLEELKQGVYDIVREQFPKIAHDAMMYWVAGGMQEAMSTARCALNQATNTTVLIEQLQQRLQGGHP